MELGRHWAIRLKLLRWPMPYRLLKAMDSSLMRANRTADTQSLQLDWLDLHVLYSTPYMLLFGGYFTCGS